MLWDSKELLTNNNHLTVEWIRWRGLLGLVLQWRLVLF